ncbi:MAG TPA: SDR family NAD(P)-dependent oxidoreductase [Polyangiaceae bacterium]|jgi:NAD(P)-dependent dehydrogenase (short-subunit alcohol dehydrogenase family)|nr:SDR family NAD(P)-dependent oxidoreductase [Polyangiaceae bacterium]
MNDVALVTGAGGALGSEVARTLAARGDRVVLMDGAGATARLEQIASTLPSACIVAGDVTDDATWREALPRIERQLGAPPALAALIAGGWRGGGPLHEQTPEREDETWRAMMAANLETVHKSLARLLPAMVAGKRGSIVVVGSRVVEQPWTGAGNAAYATSKSAVVGLAKAVAAEVLEHGVRINAVLPSTMDTAANRAAMPKADPARWVSLGSAAGVVAFLLSDAARDVSGAAIPLYGRA